MKKMFKLKNATLQALPVTIMSIMLLSMFVGCAKYKPNSFTKPVGQTEEKNDVKVCAQLLSESDCRYYFSRGLLKKGYQPVQLYVQNNSNQDFVLAASTINMPIEGRESVAACAHLDAIPRAVGWGIGGLFCWPFFIPAVVEAVQVPKVNRMLDEDFASRALDMNSKITIKANSVLNKVFFVRKENVSDQLKFALKNSRTKTIMNFGVIV